MGGQKGNLKREGGEKKGSGVGGRRKPALAHTGVPVSLCSRSSSLALTTVKNRQKKRGKGVKKGWVGIKRRGRGGMGGKKWGGGGGLHYQPAMIMVKLNLPTIEKSNMIGAMVGGAVRAGLKIYLSSLIRTYFSKIN